MPGVCATVCTIVACFFARSLKGLSARLFAYCLSCFLQVVHIFLLISWLFAGLLASLFALLFELLFAGLFASLFECLFARKFARLFISVSAI